MVNKIILVLVIALIASFSLNLLQFKTNSTYKINLTVQNKAIQELAKRVEEENKKRENDIKILSSKYKRDIKNISDKKTLIITPENVDELLDLIVSAMNEIAYPPDNP